MQNKINKGNIGKFNFFSDDELIVEVISKRVYKNNKRYVSYKIRYDLMPSSNQWHYNRERTIELGLFKKHFILDKGLTVLYGK